MANFEFPLQIKRQYEGPLDFHDVLTTANRTAWLADARRYAGQVVYDSNTAKLYVLNSAKNAWLEVPSSTSSSEIAFAAGNLTIDNININGNTVSTSTGDLVLSPVGSDVVPGSPAGANLGTSSIQWNDLWIDGTANIDSLVADTADINAGTIDGVTIGTNSVATDIRVDNLRLDGNGITSTNANGAINITPNADGDVVLDGQKFPRSIGSDFQVLTITNATNSQLAWTTPGGGSSGIGDVSFASGLGAPVDNALVKFDNATGKIIQKTDVIVSDDNNITGINNLSLNGTLTLPSTGANLIFAGPGAAAGAPFFRTLVTNDVPNLATSKITSGTFAINRGGTNSATALNNGRVMVSSAGAIKESTITTTELNYLDNVTSDVQSQINNLQDFFQINAVNIVPHVFNDTISGSESFSFNLQSNSTYQVSYSLLADVINTPGTVLSANNVIDYVGQENIFLTNVTLIDLPSTQSGLAGSTLEVQKYLVPKIIQTKSNATTVIVGFTGQEVGAYVTQLSAGSYVRFQKIK